MTVGLAARSVRQGDILTAFDRKAVYLFVLLANCASPALAQRMQFPTMVAQNPGAPVYGAPVYPPSGYAQPPSVYPPAGYTAAPAYGAPTYGAAPSPYGVQPAPSYAPPVNPNWDAYGDPGLTPPPGFQPAAVPPPQPYYAAPQPYYSAQPAPLYPDGTPQIFPQGTFQQFPSIPDQWNSAMRLRQEIRIQETFLPNFRRGDDLGVDDVELSVVFAIPIIKDQPPLLLTPGFNFHFWDGPVSKGPGTADLPGTTYDAYLDIGWNPQLTPWFGMELGVRPGVDSDFSYFSTENCFHILGRGYGVVTLTPTIQVKLGVIYLDRLDTKLWPAGGVIWSPNADSHYSFLFPNPKFAHRLTTVGNTQLWAYAAGEYGGGTWGITRDNGMHDQFDYNDVRVAVGLEWLPESKTSIRGNLEIGYDFERQLIYRSDMPHKFEPSDTMEIRTGISF